MDKIFINLLPSDILVLEKDRNKRAVFIRLAVLILVVMVAITGTLLLARFTQNQKLAQAQQQLQSAKDKVNQYQAQENLVFYLKERLQDISSLSNQESPYAQSYNLLVKLSPPGLSFSSVSLDKPGTAVLSTTADNSSTVKQFFNNLTDPRINQNKVTKVKIDSLSKDPNGQYRIDLTITLS